MGIEPHMWLCVGSRNGPRINKRCINVTLNRATSGLFIWPHLEEITLCPPAGTWGDRIQSSITHRKVFVSFTKHGHFQFSMGQISCCNSTPLSSLCISGVFPSQLLRTDITHLHNYEVRGLINSHVCGLGVNCHILIWQYINYTRPLFLQ